MTADRQLYVCSQLHIAWTRSHCPACGEQFPSEFDEAEVLARLTDQRDEVVGALRDLGPLPMPAGVGGHVGWDAPDRLDLEFGSHVGWFGQRGDARVWLRATDDGIAVSGWISCTDLDGVELAVVEAPEVLVEWAPAHS